MSDERHKLGLALLPVTDADTGSPLHSATGLSPDRTGIVRSLQSEIAPPIFANISMGTRVALVPVARSRWRGSVH
jgi:hypothetical protein